MSISLLLLCATNHFSILESGIAPNHISSHLISSHFWLQQLHTTYPPYLPTYLPIYLPTYLPTQHPSLLAFFITPSSKTIEIET
jgi:hypothetical protein